MFYFNISFYIGCFKKRICDSLYILQHFFYIYYIF